MKYLILLLLFLFQLPAFAEECDYSASSEEILKLSCNVKDIVKSILEEEEGVVPKRIYHYGKKEILNKNIEAKTVPQNDWDKYIMGDATKYALNVSRRGLYGTGGIDTNNFGRGNFNWLMEISIKDECRKPERVISLEGLHDDRRFKNWFKKRKDTPFSLSDFSKKCVIDIYDHKGYVDKKCEDLVTAFLAEGKFAVVLDHLVKKSFYVRERSCVENIRGTPEDLMEIATETPSLWMFRCGYQHQYNLSSLVIQTMASIDKPLDTATQAKLKKNLKLGHETALSYLEEAIDAKVRCDSKKSDDFKKAVEAEGDKLEDFKFSKVEFDKICN